MKKFVCAMLTVVMLLALGVSANAEGAIKIGMSGPMTGGAADYGISTRNGEQLAVDEINALGGIQLELADGSVYWLPPDTQSTYPAPPGSYRLRSTGEIVENPDYLSTWNRTREG